MIRWMLVFIRGHYLGGLSRRDWSAFIRKFESFKAIAPFPDSMQRESIVETIHKHVFFLLSPKILAIKYAHFPYQGLDLIGGN